MSVKKQIVNLELYYFPVTSFSFQGCDECTWEVGGTWKGGERESGRDRF